MAKHIERIFEKMENPQQIMEENQMARNVRIHLKDNQGNGHRRKTQDEQLALLDNKEREGRERQH